MKFEGNEALFYEKCLSELKARHESTDAFLPMLDRYVFLTMKAERLAEKIADEEVIIQHTNKADHTNEASSPRWRMYLALNKEAIALGRELQLSPASVPKIKEKKKGKKSWDLTGKMKAA
jgi:hypothetical protein